MKPQLIMLAGPNGAGKSTFYTVHLADLALPFLNADILAAETGVDSFEAARILDSERANLISKGFGFVTETVFSDPMGEKLRMLDAAVAAGFDVTLIYIGVESPDLSARRVDQRLLLGGHDVPREKLASRFARSLDNLRRAIGIAIEVEIYDNSLANDPYRPLAVFSAGRLTWRADGRLPGWTRGIIPPKRGKRSR